MKFLVVCLRLIYKIISETPKLKNNYIFAVENPTNTLKHMISVSFASCTVCSRAYTSKLRIFFNSAPIICFYLKYIMMLNMIYAYITH